MIRIREQAVQGHKKGVNKMDAGLQGQRSGVAKGTEQREESRNSSQDKSHGGRGRGEWASAVREETEKRNAYFGKSLVRLACIRRRTKKKTKTKNKNKT